MVLVLPCLLANPTLQSATLKPARNSNYWYVKMVQSAPLILATLCWGLQRVAAESTLTVDLGRRKRAGMSVAVAGRGQKQLGHQLRAGDEPDADDQPTCSCDCCNVASRRPDEVVADASVKCVPSDDHPREQCGEFCSVSSDDQVLAQAAEDKSLDYQRFCFFECKPASGTVSLAGTQCLALDSSEAEKVVDRSGNAVDPAIVYAHPQFGPRSQIAAAASRQPGAFYGYGTAQVMQPALPGASAVNAPGAATNPEMSPMQALQARHPGWVRLSTATAALPVTQRTPERNAALLTADAQTRLGELQPVPGEPAPQVAMDTAISGRAQALTAELSAKSAAAAVRAGLARDDSTGDPYTDINDIRGLADMAGRGAQRANRAARLAVGAFRQARQTNWRTALDTSETELLRERDAVRATELFRRNLPPTWRMKAVTTVNQVAKPYFDAIKATQSAIAQYNSRVSQDASKANALQAKAEKLSAEANELNSAGEAEKAQEEIAEARETMSEAQFYSSEAQSFAAKSNDAASKLRGYFDDAQKAAKIAAATMSLH